MPKISVRLNSQSISEAIRQVEDYRKRVDSLGDRMARKLADLGYTVAYGVMSGHVFSGETIESLEVKEEGEGKYTLYAASQALLFFEFGAGARYGGGYPWDDANWVTNPHYGPGTYPGAGHWDDPNGWWFPTDDPRLIIKRSEKTGQGWGHSYGNKPYMPFYKAGKAMRDDLVRVAKECLKEEGGG